MFFHLRTLLFLRPPWLLFLSRLAGKLEPRPLSGSQATERHAGPGADDHLSPHGQSHALRAASTVVRRHSQVRARKPVCIDAPGGVHEPHCHAVNTSQKTQLLTAWDSLCPGPPASPAVDHASKPPAQSPQACRGSRDLRPHPKGQGTPHVTPTGVKRPGSSF